MGMVADFSQLIPSNNANNNANYNHALWGWSMAMGFLVYHVYATKQVNKFLQWLNQPDLTRPPPLPKILSESAQTLYQKNAQHQQAHQQALQFVTQIRHALSELQDGVVLINNKDCIEWCNPTAQAMLHIDRTDINRHILSVIRTPKFHDYYTHLDDFEEGIRLHAWQDMERFVQCEMTQFGDERLLIIYDVTRLAHLEQMRQDFVANVSHELRTPLTVIMGYVETLSEQPDLSPRWQRAYAQMLQQTKRMNNIINDLLLLSRLENDEKRTDLTNIDMPKLLIELFDDSQIYNKNHHHLIHLHIDSQRHLYGHEKYLTSALSNLVTNAIKYTPDGGEISINWYEKDDAVCFSVADNGIGIEGRHIERLTERFYRVDSGRSRETGGTGLGLAIVKHVLYQHGATLHIQSQVGKGSTFTVYFPKKNVVG